MNKDMIIIGLLIAMTVAIMIAFLVATPNIHKLDTNMTIKGNSTFSEGDMLKFKLTDSNGTPLKNKTLKITITDKKHNKSNYTLNTNDNGTGKLELDKEPGKYNVTVEFSGNEQYNPCNASKNITIREEVVETQPSASSDTYVESTDGVLTYGYKDGRYGFWTPTGNFIEDKSRALSGQDPVEPFMRDGDFYSQI